MGHVRQFKSFGVDKAREHSIRRRKSAFIGCPKCNSKLAAAWLMGEHCPLCRTDLRPQSVQDKIKDYDKKLNAASEALTAAFNKNSVTATDWLVMYEYYCKEV